MPRTNWAVANGDNAFSIKSRGSDDSGHTEKSNSFKRFLRRISFNSSHSESMINSNCDQYGDKLTPGRKFIGLRVSEGPGSFGRWRDAREERRAVEDEIEQSKNLRIEYGENTKFSSSIDDKPISYHDALFERKNSLEEKRFTIKRARYSATKSIFKSKHFVGGLLATAAFAATAVFTFGATAPFLLWTGSSIIRGYKGRRKDIETYREYDKLIQEIGEEIADLDERIGPLKKSTKKDAANPEGHNGEDASTQIERRASHREETDGADESDFGSDDEYEIKNQR